MLYINKLYCNKLPIPSVPIKYSPIIIEFKILDINIFEKTTEADINTLRSRLMEIGDCVICVGDLQLIKVHVHTNEPGVALTHALNPGK